MGLGDNNNNIVNNDDDFIIDDGANDIIALDETGNKNYLLASGVAKNYGLKNDQQISAFIEDKNIENVELNQDIETIKNDLENGSKSYSKLAEKIVSGEIKLNGYKPKSNDIKDKNQIIEVLGFVEGVRTLDNIKQIANIEANERDFQATEIFNLNIQSTKAMDFEFRLQGMQNIIEGSMASLRQEIYKESQIEQAQKEAKINKEEPKLETEEIKPKKAQPKKVEEEISDDDFVVEKNDNGPNVTNNILKDDDDGPQINNNILEDDDDDGFEYEKNDELNKNLNIEQVKQSYDIINENEINEVDNQAPQTDLEEFCQNFGTGFANRKDGGQYLKDLDARVNSSQTDILDSDEKKLGFYKIQECKYGKPADFNTIKKGIEIMDRAQANYVNHHNIFARALSHLGLFKDIAKEREQINFMKETFNKQHVDNSTIDQIRNGKINKLPSSTTEARKHDKHEMNNLMQNIVQKVKAEVELKNDNGINRTVNDFNTVNMEKYGVDKIIEDRKAEYRNLRDVVMVEKYGKDWGKSYKADHDAFKKSLGDKAQEFKNDLKHYNDLHDSVDDKKYPGCKTNILIEEMKKNGLDYTKELENYKKEISTTSLNEAINAKFNKLYNKGIFVNEAEMNTAIDQQTKSLDEYQDPSKFNNLNEKSIDYDKLSEETSLDQTKAKSQEVRNEGKVKEVNIGAKE